MKKKLLLFAAIVSCFISAGLFLRYNVTANANKNGSELSPKNAAANTAANNNQSSEIPFFLAYNVNNNYSSEELEKIKSIDNRLTEVEYELADYLENISASKSDNLWRRRLKKNEQASKLWNALNEIEDTQCNEFYSLDSVFYWRMFFDEKEFNFDEPRDDFDERAFNYLCFVDPVWVLRSAVYVRHNATNVFKGRWPNRFMKFPVYKDYLTGKRAESPLLGISHILKRSYTASRGEKCKGELIRALTACDISAEGKDWTDIGAGSGFILPFIREAIGKEASLTATELDPFTLDLLTFMAEPADAQVVRCTVSDCCLPEASQDIISMVGVHLGDDFPSNYESSTLPWLITINNALRKDGVLLIHDGNADLLEKGVVEKVERAGFELRKLFLPYEPIDKNDGENCDRLEFIAVFEKANK